MPDHYQTAAMLGLLGTTFFGDDPHPQRRDSTRPKTQRGMRLKRNRKNKAAKVARRKNRR